jgi:hypothetical protein
MSAFEKLGWCHWCGAAIERRAQPSAEKGPSTWNDSAFFCNQACRIAYYHDVAEERFKRRVAAATPKDRRAQS